MAVERQMGQPMELAEEYQGCGDSKGDEAATGRTETEYFEREVALTHDA